MNLLCVSDAAAELTHRSGRPVSPREITQLLYLRRAPGCDFPIVGGRRLIPREALPQLLAALERRSWSTSSSGRSA